MSVGFAEAVAIVAIGDGAVGAMFRSRHVARWLAEPQLWRSNPRVFLAHPGLTWALGVAQVPAAVRWAARIPVASRGPAATAGSVSR